MTGISSTLPYSSPRTEMAGGDRAVDVKSLSAGILPPDTLRTSGGAVLVASAFAPAAPAAPLLETAVANLRWMAEFARPLAGQALRAMVATAGSAASLAGQLVALGRPIALEVLKIATAAGAAQVVAALVLALGIVAGTATPTGNGELPSSMRNTPPRRRTDGGNTQPEAVVPPKQTQTQTQIQAPGSTRTARPTAPSAAQVQQNQASVAAVELLTRANSATPPMYAAVEKFYDAASGGRAARSKGSLAAPMQAVRQSRSALNDAIVQSEKTIAGSAPQDRAALNGWHDTLVTARTSIDKWITSADAFSAGLDRPGGSRTAQPPLPRPPTSVVNAPGSGRTSDQVAQQLVTTYEDANNAMRRGTAEATSPTRRAAPVAAPDPAAAQSQAARALLTQTDPITARMNKGVEAFYQHAAGGKAARQTGVLTDALRTVTESKAELNKLILASNKSIAASSPADYPRLDSWRTKLREARDAVDAWLPKANAFAAGLSGPGGKPALPAIPGFVAGKGGASSTADSAPLARAHDSAQAALAKTASVRTTVSPGSANAPTINVASTMPANAKYQADVWLNRTNGAVSPTAQSGPGWEKGVLAMSGITPRPETPNGGGEVPGTGHINAETFNQAIKAGNVTLVVQGAPGGGDGKDPKDKHVLHAWVNTLVGLLGTAGAGGFLFFSKLGADQQAIAQREADFHPQTGFKPFTLPQKLGTASEKLDAIASAWEHYLGEVPRLLKRSALEGTSNASIADQFKAGDNKFADQFKADAQAFVTNLRRAGAADLAKTKDPEVQARILNALAERQFIPRSFDIKNAASRELYKDMAGRPYKALSELTLLVQAEVRSMVGSILASPAAPPTGNTAPASSAPTTAAPTGVQSQPAKTPRQELDEILGKLSGQPPQPAVPAAPPAIVVRPPSVATTTPAAPVKPPVTRAPPVAVAPKPVKSAEPSAAEVKKREVQAALDSIGDAVASAQLIGPPATTTLAQMQFKRSMFIEPGKEGNSDSLQAGLAKAQTIQRAALDAYNSATKYDAQMAINVPLRSIQVVIAELNSLQKAVNNPVVAPAAPVTPNSLPPANDIPPPPADIPAQTQNP